MADLLVNLYDLQCKYDYKKVKENGITIRRAMSPDKQNILDFITTYYTKEWANETEYALVHTPISCYVAVKNKEVVGFACYDATAKGYFGPIAIKPDVKGCGVGQALMHDTLVGMRENGYGYAVIGWVDDAIAFYEKSIHAFSIPDSEPENTIYQNLISLREVSSKNMAD